MRAWGGQPSLSTTETTRGSILYLVRAGDDSWPLVSTLLLAGNHSLQNRWMVGAQVGKDILHASLESTGQLDLGTRG